MKDDWMVKGSGRAIESWGIKNGWVVRKEVKK